MPAGNGCKLKEIQALFHGGRMNIWSLLTQCSLPSLFTKGASPTFPKDADLRRKCPHQSNGYKYMSLLTLQLEGMCWVTAAMQCSAIGREPASWHNLGTCFKDSLCPAHSAELTVALDGRLVGSCIKIKKYPEHASSEHKMRVKATARPLYVLDQSYINSEKFKNSFHEQTKALDSCASGLVFCSCREDTL